MFGAKRLTARKTPGTIRIFLVGGSQAWGSGAASSSETFGDLLERRLRSKGLPVEVLNSAVNGGGIRTALYLFRELLSGFEPDILIADVGLNESAGLSRMRDPEQVKERSRLHAELLAQLIASCRAQQADLLLCLEPMSSEPGLRPVAVLYENLEAAARGQGAALVDPVPVIREREIDRFVWWDTAHFTPYGHELMAEILAPSVERLARARLARDASTVNREL